MSGVYHHSEILDNIVIFTDIQIFLLKKRIINKETGCWLIREKRTDKYISLCFDGIVEPAHRMSARAFLNLDEIETNRTEICHKLHCPFKACFNPEHIYIGDRSSNRKDYWKSVREDENHCAYGHIYSINKSGRKHCKVCDKRRRKNRFNPSHVKYSRPEWKHRVQ